MKKLADAMSLVQEYWFLVPELDIWQEGDEFIDLCSDDGSPHVLEQYWLKIPSHYAGETFSKARGFNKFHYAGSGEQLIIETARRKIPENIRQSEARWILYNSLATIAPNKTGWIFAADSSLGVVVELSEFNLGLRKFASSNLGHEALHFIGGELAIDKMFTEGPGILWKWVMENRNEHPAT